MSPARAHMIPAICALVCGFGVASASADEPAPRPLELQPPAAARAVAANPYARYSDGPRNVPRPRGAALARAQQLGLGTREAATLLLTHAPDPRWVAAVRGARRSTLLWPIDGARFGRGFGFTRRERRELRHEGIDVAGASGAEVHAVADGIVAYADNGVRGFGNCVMIVHANGWVSLYAHLSRVTVQPGWRAVRGERIGLVGSTGIARGPHLHFELRNAGRTVDPEPLFAAIPGRASRLAASSGGGPARTGDRDRCGRGIPSRTCAGRR